MNEAGVWAEAPRPAPGELPSRKAKQGETTPSVSALRCTDEAREPHRSGAGRLGLRLSGGIINKIDAPNGCKKDHGATHYQGLKSLIIRFSAAVTRRTHPGRGPPAAVLSPLANRGP